MIIAFCFVRVGALTLCRVVVIEGPKALAGHIVQIDLTAAGQIDKPLSNHHFLQRHRDFGARGRIHIIGRPVMTIFDDGSPIFCRDKRHKPEILLVISRFLSIFN